MKVEIKTSENHAHCVVTREKGDYAESEYELFDDIRGILNERNYNLTNRIPVVDGHMFGDYHTHYLRPKKEDNTPHIYIYDSQYALRLLDEDFNNEDSVRLDVEVNVFNSQPNCIELIRKLENG